MTQPPPESRVPEPAILFTYEDFFRSRYKDLLLVVMYAGASMDEADDAAQQAMIDAHRNWSTIRNPWPWIRRAAVNVYIKIRQREKQRLPRTARGGHITPAGYDDTAITAWEDSQWVSQMLGRLPPAQRQVMTFIVEGWQPCEVALMLGKTDATVRQNLKLARDRLKRELAREHDPQNPAPASWPNIGEEVK